MDRHSKPVTLFAWPTFVLFLGGTLSVASLDMAERADLISRTTEGISRLGVLSLLLGFLSFLAMRRNVAPLIRSIVVLFVLTLFFQLLISSTDDMRSLDGVALLGNDGAGHTIVNKLLAAFWMCCGFWFCI